MTRVRASHYSSVDMRVCTHFKYSGKTDISSPELHRQAYMQVAPRFTRLPGLQSDQ